MTTNTLTASIVSRKLRAAGWNPIGSADPRRVNTTGIRVQRPSHRGGEVIVTIQDTDGTLDIAASVEKLTAAIIGCGFGIASTSVALADGMAWVYVTNA